MNDVQSLLPALFTLHNFLFFSLLCPIFFAFSAKMATYLLVIDNVYFVISS